MNLLKPSSPLTGNFNTINLRKISAIQISNQWNEAFHIRLSNEFSQVGTIFHWKCLDTGFEWYTPAEAAGDGFLYQQLQRFPWYYMYDKWEFHAALN